MKIKIFITLIIFSGLFSSNSIAAIKNSPVMDKFIQKMVTEHGFKETKLRKLFKSATIKKSILKAMSRPAEGGHTPWHKYRKIFLNTSRINGGAKFWRNNAATLAAVEKQYGVPAQIIVAIIGVETQYGGNTGSYKVLDALATLGFAFPRRSEFFLSELEHFLLLCREEKLNPLTPKGSYAGAMGLPQFMPSSYRNHAADFEQDGHRDIWKNPADAIASVANYFIQYGWQTGQSVAYQVAVNGNYYQSALTKGLKPDFKLAQLQDLKILIPSFLDLEAKAKLFSFEQPKGLELWLGLDNFYTITRYNHSSMYAMAVYQLSEAILAKMKR